MLTAILQAQLYLTVPVIALVLGRLIVLKKREFERARMQGGQKVGLSGPRPPISR